MVPTRSDLWIDFSMPEIVDLDCLLPNGFLITIQCARETTLSQVKCKIWEENKKYANLCASQLKHIDSYVFVSVSQEAKTVEYYDNEKRICDLKLFYAMFKLVEAQGDLIEKSFNSNLSKTIGLYMSEIEQNKDIEIVKFRLELLRILLNILSQQQLVNLNEEFKSLIDCVYAPRLEIDPSLLDMSIIDTANSLNNCSVSNASPNRKKHIAIDVHVMETDRAEHTFHLNVPLSCNPTDIVTEVIKSKLFSSNQTQQQIEDIVQMFKSSYILNVCGCDEIFYGKFSFVAAC